MKRADWMKRLEASAKRAAEDQTREAERQAQTRSKREAELRAQGHTAPIYGVNEPVPAAKSRRLQRSRGQPYGRCRIQTVIPGGNGRPARFVYAHPTRGTTRARYRRPQPQSTPSWDATCPSQWCPSSSEGSDDR